ncbi:hypothetical protein [Mycobacterium sp.]|uniref:hypothetical protein n=1 Tax=Mycobacterium sp. TaxID=1785 RepID=UPI0011F94ABD|nr:hypothetical protein [Mycobacterium sp.]TAM63535.1 MAG: hypothetical protein EPN51_26565 [Mycobacterium sp.]
MPTPGPAAVRCRRRNEFVTQATSTTPPHAGYAGCPAELRQGTLGELDAAFGTDRAPFFGTV